MRRHATKIEDDTLYVETEDGWLEVGTMAAIYDLVGGREYDIEYEKRHAAFVDWVDTDDAGVLTIDVRETLSDMTYPGAFVERLRARDLAADGDGEHPARTRYFADVMAEVWESKGNYEDDDENPFT